MYKVRTIAKSICVMMVFAALLFLSGCSRILNASVSLEQTVNERDIETTAEQVNTITDVDRTIESAEYTEIVLSELNDSIRKENFTYEKNCLRITKGGTYLISGKSNDCQLVIQAFDDEIVHLILNGVEINAPDSSAVFVESAGKVVITAKEGTENSLSDGKTNALEQKACIFSNSDLTINGSGILYVYGYYHDAIRSKDCLKIIGSNVRVRTKNDGLRGNDGVLIADSNVEIESEGNGILTNSEQGSVWIQGGSCKVIAGEHAVSADYLVAVKECTHDFYAVLENIKCSGKIEMEEEP